jgi:transposase InsO family protein
MARYAEHDRTAIDAVAEHHYNTERNHSSLANRPPVTRVRNDRGRTAS